MDKTVKAILNTESKDYMRSAFYFLCSQDSHTNDIESLFLEPKFKKKVDGSVLNNGLLGSIEKNQEQHIPLIFDFMKKHKIKPDFKSLSNVFLSCVEKRKEKTIHTIFEYMDKNGLDDVNKLKNLQMMFNYANTLNNFNLAQTLDDQYSILKNSMRFIIAEPIILSTGALSSWARLNDEGSLSIASLIGTQPSIKQEQIDNYSKNPILFNLENFHPVLLDHLLKNDYEIHPSVIKHGIVKNIHSNNTEAVLYLFSHEKCIDIIKNSNEIKAFIKHEEFAENKKDARIALSMIELKEQLSDKNATQKKLKV